MNNKMVVILSFIENDKMQRLYLTNSQGWSFTKEQNKAYLFNDNMEITKDIWQFLANYLELNFRKFKGINLRIINCELWQKQQELRAKKGVRYVK